MLAKSSGQGRRGRRAEKSPSALSSDRRRADRALERSGEHRVTAESDVDLGALCAFLRQSLDASKRQLARALHDSPAQTVSAALLTLFLLEREKNSMSASAQQALQDAQSLLSACGDELRRLSHELFPPLLEEVGLQPPLRALARKAGLGHVRLKVADVPRLPRRAEEAAYRFAEEALADVLNARSAVDLELATDGARGVTIALEGRLRTASPSRRLALMSLAQRVREAGGVFSSRALQGTRKGRLRLAATFATERTPRRAATSTSRKPKPAPPDRRESKLQPLAFRGTEGQLRRGGR
jgi:signal transduction histidine kinase